MILTEAARLPAMDLDVKKISNATDSLHIEILIYHRSDGAFFYILQYAAVCHSLQSWHGKAAGSTPKSAAGYTAECL